MKKYLALILALVMCLAFVACGSKEAPAEDPAPVEDAVPEDAAPEDAAPEEEATGDWNDYADFFTEAYAGLTEAGESVIFVVNADATFGALVVADTENVQSASFVGEMTAVETETGYGYTITDETNGLELTFTVIDNGDGTYGLDAGDLGVWTVEAIDVATALDTLNIVDAQYAPVA